MQRLRGTYSAPPIESLNLRPFLNLHVARQKARLRKLVAAGLAPQGDKASLRAEAEQAAAEHRITRVPTGKRALPKPTGD